jgi:UDP-glucose 4-epimerase
MAFERYVCLAFVSGGARSCVTVFVASCTSGSESGRRGEEVTTTLVTGGNGFIGRYVVEALLERGRNVNVLDRAGNRLLGATTYLGDIRDPTAVTEAMSHVDSWIHLAGVLGTQETIANPIPSAETNLLGGLNILQAAAQYQLPGVNIAVGNHWETNTYSITKSTMERFCKMYREYRETPVTVVRALNAYGPRQSVATPYGPSKVRKIMPSFIMRALNGKAIEVYGTGEQIMDMVYVEDVAEILIRALERTEEHGGQEQIYEAGTGRATSVLDVATEVLRTIGSGSIHYLPMRPGETPNARVLADPTTLFDLGWHEDDFTPLEEGVAYTVDYYRSQL